MRRVLLASLVLFPAPALAGDLGEAVNYADRTIGPQVVSNYADQNAPSGHEALEMLRSRDVEVGRPLDEYRCEQAAVDGEFTLRTNGNERWAGRTCRELRFLRDHVPGYRIMGPPPMRAFELEPLLAQAEAQTDVPAALLQAIVRFSSGGRPGLISDDGHQGLMQLSPELLRAEGIEPTNLLDPAQNLRLGALYIRAMTLRYKNLKMALAAFQKGPGPVARAGGLPGDPEILWFVREVMRLYYASIREVPTGIAAEAMTFVWTWLE